MPILLAKLTGLIGTSVNLISISLVLISQDCILWAKINDSFKQFTLKAY